MSTRTHLCLQDYDAIGFDLDHTLAKYNLVEMIKLSYNAIIDYLTSQKNYPASIRVDITQHKDFICKGLFVDAERGNIVKLSHGGKILKAFHGTRELSTDELKTAYNTDLTWQHFPEAIEAVSSRAASGSFLFWDNFFDIPALLACIYVVDHLDKQNGGPLDCYQDSVWKDVRGSLDYNYSYKAFADNTGYFFPVLKKSPEKFYQACSEGVKEWLTEMKTNGKCVFLITSSHIDFAELTASMVMGPDWMSYFDIVVTNSRKPGFFKEKGPFLQLEGYTETISLDWFDLKPHQVYSGGNHQDLEKFIGKQIQKQNCKILYFGDSLCSDAFPVKTMTSWDVALVLEEMEAEGYHPQHNTHHYWSPEDKKAKIIRKVNLEVDPAEEAYILSQTWGSFFYHPEDDPFHNRHMNTFWGELITKYCDIAIPSIEYIAGFRLDEEFPVFNHDDDGNTDGFSPAPPKPLLDLQ